MDEIHISNGPALALPPPACLPINSIRFFSTNRLLSCLIDSVKQLLVLSLPSTRVTRSVPSKSRILILFFFLDHLRKALSSLDRVVYLALLVDLPEGYANKGRNHAGDQQRKRQHNAPLLRQLRVAAKIRHLPTPLSSSLYLSCKTIITSLLKRGRGGTRNLLNPPLHKSCTATEHDSIELNLLAS